MKLEITPKSIYEWIGRIVFWGALVLFVLYNAYSLGVKDGLSDGYVRGYVDGRLNLRPADPNLTPEERHDRQKDGPRIAEPKQNSQKGDGANAVQS